MRLEDVITLTAEHAQGRLCAGTIGHVGVVLFNQPEKRNAINLEMWEGIHAAADAFEGDRAVRVVVLAGTGGKAFTSGNDISQFAERRGNAESNAEFMGIMARGRASLRALSKPTVACIEGFCLGGGLATALLADLRVAQRDAVFGIPAARMGIAYAFDATQDLVAAIGPSRARWLLYTARRFTASDAHGMGLIDVLADDAPAETLALAQSIADNAPLSVRASKFAIAQVSEPAEMRDKSRLAEDVRRCFDSADYREGREAFMAKREPIFKGA